MLSEDVEPTKYVRCGVAKVLLAMAEAGEGQEDELRELLARPVYEIEHVALMKALRKHGYNIGADSIRRHRKGHCHCESH